MSKMIHGEMRLSRETLREVAPAVLEKDAPFRVRAGGHSMSPVIREGDVIVIAPLKGKSPGCGDILAFINSTNQSLTVHRVVKKAGNHFFLRGDNSLGPADMVPADRLIGRLTRIEQNGKRKHFGLGPERVLIGLLNRGKGFAYLIRTARQAHRRLRRNAA